jgi:hypothetical protein
MRLALAWAVALFAAALWPACNCSPAEGFGDASVLADSGSSGFSDAGADSGAGDAGETRLDSGPADASMGDGGSADAGPEADASLSDAAVSDSGVLDAGPSDAGGYPDSGNPPDSGGSVDAAAPDAAEEDAGGFVAGPPDSGAIDSGVPDAGPSNWVNVTPDGGPSGRRFPAMTYLADVTATVLFGGEGPGGQVFGDTWVWDGFSWTQQSASGGPGPRSRAVMATINGEVVMFGGRNASGNDLNDTWAWDGFTWTQISICGPSPSPRSSPAMTFDAAHAGILLFGGVQGTTTLTDTWSFDGFAWTQASPATTPTGSGSVAMVYATEVAGSVLFVGEDSAWFWSDDWSSANNAGALSQARYDFGVAYAKDVLTAVMFGGDDGNGTDFGDTWTWSASGWFNDTQTGPHPSPRDGYGIAYQAANLEVVLFGGYNASTGDYFGDTWVWTGP